MLRRLLVLFHARIVGSFMNDDELLDTAYNLFIPGDGSVPKNEALMGSIAASLLVIARNSMPEERELRMPPSAIPDKADPNL